MTLLYAPSKWAVLGHQPGVQFGGVVTLRTRFVIASLIILSVPVVSTGEGTAQGFFASRSDETVPLEIDGGLNQSELLGLEVVGERDHPGEYAGWSFDQTTKSLIIYIKAPTTPSWVLDEITYVKGLLEKTSDTSDPHYPALVSSTAYSYEDLDRLRTSLLEAGVGKVVVDDWIDPQQGRVVFRVNSVEDASVASSSISSMKLDGTALVIVDLTVDRGSKSSRNSDAAAHWSGNLVSWSPYVCTGGFTIRKSNGTRYQLFEGHCSNGATGTAWYSGTYFVGNTSFVDYTNGGWDIALLGGSTYAGRAYCGAPGTSTNCGISGTSTPSYVAGDGAISGLTPQQGLVLSYNMCHTYSSNGWRTCHLADSIASYPTPNLWTGGDSGGPVVDIVNSTTVKAVGGIDGAGSGHY